MKRNLPSISLGQTRSIANVISEAAGHPSELDEITESLGITPVLANPHLANQVDLTEFGLGKATYIPIQISSRQGGRKSLYFLQPGEKVLAGLFATSDGIAFRYTTRETGRSIPAQGGDRYSEEIRTADGKVVAVLRGYLEITDSNRGEGRMVFEDAEPAALAAAVKRRRVRVWIAWSFILIDTIGDDGTLTA